MLAVLLMAVQTILVIYLFVLLSRAIRMQKEHQRADKKTVITMIATALAIVLLKSFIQAVR